MALIQILPRYDYEFQRDSMTLMLKTLSSGRKRTLKDLFKGFDYTFIIDCDDQGLNGKISFYFEVPESDKEKSMQTLKTMFKEKADVLDAEPLAKRQCVNTLHARDDEDAERKQKKRLATFNDPQIFLYILGLLSKRTRITIDFSIRKEFLASGLFRGVSTDVQAECLIRVWGNTKYDRNVIKDISNNISSLTAGERQLQIDYKDSYRTTNMTGTELLNFIQFPSIRTQKNLLDRVYFLEVGQITLQPEEFASGLRVGTLYHPVMRDREIRISYEQLRKHMEISGMTGSGKSSFFEEAVDSILLDKVLGKKNVPGFTLFDPMESSALGVIDKILKLKHDGHDVEPLLKKVHYIDLNDDDYVFPIALLYKGIEPTEILDFFKMLFSDTTTVQIDRLMSDAINALLKDNQEYSIADIQKIFENEELREEIKMRISDDPYASESLQFLSAKFNSTQLDPIRNRLSPFLNTEHKKLMFGLTGKYDSLKDIRKWMDEGTIVCRCIDRYETWARLLLRGGSLMKKYSLQLRLTLIVGLITALACIFLTLNSLYSAHSYYGDYAELIQSGMVEYDLMLPQDEGMLEFDPLASYERATQKFSLQSLLAMGSIVLLSLAAAYWATGRVMKPLKELTESVQSMNDQNLNQRMSLDKTQGEVLILGESYNHMLARLEESFLIQKSFAANAAHELKTPLAIIKASSEVLKMTPSPKIEDYEEFMQDTDQSLNRIIKTVDGLLALANSSSALLDRVDLFLLLQQAVSELKPVAQKHKLTLELEADDNVTVTGNKDLLYRLLFNLIENAIKYNKQGGNVKISLHLVSKYAEVKVEDTGIGIQPQAMDHIFEPFYREDVSRSQQIPGSGLGLAVVKMIAEHHQGKVEVSSEPGIGSIFILTLPVSE